MFDRPMWCDRNGIPIDMFEAERLLADLSYVTVACTAVTYGGNLEVAVQVSTVWLGVNMNFAFAGPPIIFETMVFGGDLDGNCWRYATEDQARKGHAEAVVMVAAAIADPVVMDMERYNSALSSEDIQRMFDELRQIRKEYGGE